MDNNIYGYNPQIDERSSAIAFPALIRKVYLWMTLALALTGLTAYYVAANEQWLFTIVQTPALYWGLLIGEVALVWILTSRIMRMSFATAGIMFAVFSILNGIVCSTLLLVYTETSIASTFLITAGTFGAMSLYGAFTKRDLTSWGRILFMALLGLIIATVVNCFVASSTLQWGLTYLGVLVFCGLTAYDTQKMKEILRQMEGTEQDGMLKMALLCSLSLYLDFINLFIYLLRIFGDRK